MSRSKAKRKPAGGRLQTFGIFATLVLVAVLIGSLVAGVMKGRSRAALPAAADSPSAPTAADAVPAGRVRVQVLNASGRPGLAREATRVLRDRGFDVKEFGNGQGFPPDSSVVLDRVGRIEVARQVADAVGIRRITARPDSNLYLDATVVLGRDWSAPRAP
ncbi:MAG TPA: LytR C-terminal domain-containing protein [Longimicrobium sp.]|jgi:hypothetical protein